MPWAVYPIRKKSGEDQGTRAAMSDIPSTTKISTTITDAGFEQQTDICGRITREIVNVKALQYDEAFRAKLIELGWTPPEGSEHTERMAHARRGARTDRAGDNGIA